jgi:hypothetical protein
MGFFEAIARQMLDLAMMNELVYKPFNNVYRTLFDQTLCFF